MASVNKVILVGNLGADPEIRYLPSGEGVANLRLATTDRYKNKASGEMKEITEWHRVSFFGRIADVCGEYLAKGSSVYVEGRIRTRKWTDQSGAEKYSTEIVGERMQMIGGKPSGNDGGNQRQEGRHPNRQQQNGGNGRDQGSRPQRQDGNRQAHQGQSRGSFDDMSDDIPY